MIAAIVAVCLAAQVSATDTVAFPFKLGYVDREELFKAPRVERMLLPLRDRIKVSESEFDARWDQLLAQVRDFESKKEFMDQPGREEKEAELKKMRDEIAAFVREKRESLEDERDTTMRQVLSEVRDLVRQVAQEQGYSLVLWKSAVAYGAPEHDLTQVVMKRLVETEGK